MANYIKGAAIPNATSYTLHNKNNSYAQLAEQTENTSNEISFDLDALSLTAGTYTLVVKAHAEGYTDSDYSNEVVYTIAEIEDGTIDITSQFEFQENYMISTATTEGKFQAYNGSWVANENYVDISEYSEIKIKMSKTSAAETNTGIAFYNANKTHVVGYAHTLGDSQYGVMEKTFKRVASPKTGQTITQEVIEIPETAVYVRTTYWNTATGTSNYQTSFGEFYCKATPKTTA